MASANWCFSRRDHKGAWSSNDAHAEVESEVLDVPQAVRALQHEWQPVDGDALRHRLVPGCGHEAAVIVGAIPRDVDHRCPYPPHGQAAPRLAEDAEHHMRS
jgi:hypothetical protein